MRKNHSVFRTVIRIFEIAISAFLLPILTVNLILLVKSYTAPEEVPGIFGVSPMVVVTDSMSPTINGGDMIFCKKKGMSEISVGDIIAFFDPESNREIVVTHRVIAVLEDEGGLYFITKGDANNAEDSAKVRENHLVGVYQMTVPIIGKIVMFSRTPKGILLMVVLPVLAFIAIDLVRKKKEERKQAKEKEDMEEEIIRLKKEINGSHETVSS